MPGGTAIAQNLADVRQRIARAAARAGRTPREVRLVAVSKTFGAELIREAVEAGQRDFGENRVQEGLQKVKALEDLALTWHLVGHLQTNKARRAAEAFAWIQSIDGAELLARLDRAAQEAGTRPRVLIQVDLAGEVTKHGVRSADVLGLARAACDSRAVELHGLMLLPPLPEIPEASRPWFRRLRQLRDELIASGIPAERLGELSMGMSQDFEVAIEEGATIVRVGTAVFGRRPPAPVA